MDTFGYAGTILSVNLSSGNITTTPTLDYAEKFLGGKGIAARIYWDEVLPDVDALNADNCLIFATGPLAGLPAIGGSRWVVCGKSPATSPQQFCCSNLGGGWGAELKSAGYDALVIRGRSEKPTSLFIHDGTAELRDASPTWGKGAVEAREALKEELGRSVRVAAIGPAGENMAVSAIILADNDASGSAGFGAVIGSKRLKAVVVKGSGVRAKIAQPVVLESLIGYYQRLGRGVGEIWGRRFDVTGPRTKRDPCYGCLGRCPRVIYEAADGEKGKFMCAGAMFYAVLAERYYGQPNEVSFYANRICDNYGLDVNAIDRTIYWLRKCHEAGILTDDNIGIPISRAGSLEFVEALVRKISSRDGFGDLLADGMERAAEYLGPDAKKQIKGFLCSRTGHGEIYGPRLYVTHGILYAMEPRVPIGQLHEVGVPVGKWVNWVKKLQGAYVSTKVLRSIGERFWGSEIAADFSTYEGKALAAKRIQDRQYAKESLVLCDFLWPITELEYTQDHVGDPTLESRILSAVTGNRVDERALYVIGERIHCLQRAILAREGHRGRKDDVLPDEWHTVPLKMDMANADCIVPGKEGVVISRKGTVVDRDEFEKTKEEYYRLRHWDVATGLQTSRSLESLGLGDVAQELGQRGLIAQA